MDGVNLRKKKIKHQISFDPYQVFEVEHSSCLTLEIKIICGRNITKGWFFDSVDTPDPYIVLDIKKSPSDVQKSKVINNNANPIWNETFTFLLDKNESYELELHLKESNTVVDQEYGSVCYDLSEVLANNLSKKTFIFNKVSEIDVEFTLNNVPDLRYSLCLCQEEKDFLIKRREKVKQSIQRILNMKEALQNNEVPTIAVMGSGGGFRAVIAYHGVMKALGNSGILDCSTYIAGLSGSSWYLSTLYSHQKWPNMLPGDMETELRKNISSNWMWNLLNISTNTSHLVELLKRKKETGQPISFADFFGHLIGQKLFKDRLDTRLTNLQEKIKEGQQPLPLMTCINVKAQRSAKSFQEWVEFSPYEIGMPKYGTFLKPNLFGCQFYKGKILRFYEEPPLHFLQGVWGSAFAVLFRKLLRDRTSTDPVELIRQDSIEKIEAEKTDKVLADDRNTDETDEETTADSEPLWHVMLSKLLGKNHPFMQTRSGRAAYVFNFMRGLSLNTTYPYQPFLPPQMDEDTHDRKSEMFDGLRDVMPLNMEHLCMVDAGLTFNSPYPLVMRPQRKVNIILSFDFTYRSKDTSQPFEELKHAAKWAELNNLKFPPIPESIFKEEKFKELYIFKDPNDSYCPIVLHFVMINDKFRNFSAPGVPRSTEQERDFADFELSKYSTYNFNYSHFDFDRLSKLMEFNTLLHVGDIKQAIRDVIKQKKENPVSLPCTKEEAENNHRISIGNRQRLSKFIGDFEKGTSISEEEDEENNPMAWKDLALVTQN